MAARCHSRKRVMLPIQRSETAPVQRLLNIICPGSYVQPHCHPGPQSIELVHVLQGAIRVWIFDDSGNITDDRNLVSGTPYSLVDLEPNIWHTFAALEPDTVILEIKKGPYDKEQDKVFAPWAPAESDLGSSDYLNSLLSRVPQS